MGYVLNQISVKRSNNVHNHCKIYLSEENIKYLHSLGIHPKQKFISNK